MGGQGTRRSLVLASASPARLRTLRAAGLDPAVIVSGIDEQRYAAGSSAELALELARAKARAVADLEAAHGSIVIGCDSLLDLDGAILGKPTDVSDAIARWRTMQGRSGVLVTGHCVIDNRSGVARDEVATTTVHFAEVSDDEIAAYVATGEPLQVAGAFTIDGLGAAFVTGIEGDHHNVVGVSVPL
ncbi:MAG: Maf family nucleotide pyrophosphatase, partial [Actinomycetota bacterium]|nr:Maf family nucleotide pyrophosphatase [Actinomycetota bacterium]